MKKTLTTIMLAAGLAIGAYAQGTVAFNNLNGSAIPVTYNGTPYDGVFTVEFWGGSSAGDLVLLGSTVGNFGGGIFYNADDIAIPGVPLGGTATLLINAWTGSFANYAAALQSTDGTVLVGTSGIFTNPTGGTGAPPGPGANLDNFTGIALVPVPEPSMLALAGLGAAGMSIFRRRK